MATQTLYTTGTTTFSKGESLRVFRNDYVLDFTVATVASGDVLKVIALPKGAFVLGVSLAVVTAATTSTTASIGDAGSGTRYATTLAVDAAAGTVIAPAVYTGHYYTAADAISVTVAGSSPTAGKLVISVMFADMNGLTHLPATVAVL